MHSNPRPYRIKSNVFLQIYRRTRCTSVTNKPRVAEILERGYAAPADPRK